MEKSIKGKSTPRGRDLFYKYRKILMFISDCFSIFPLRSRIKLFESKRYSRGLYGIAVRYILFRSIAEKCGDNVLINQGCFILNVDKLSVGSTVSIQPMCYIDAAGGVSIGNDVSIAHGVTILSTSHNYSGSTVPIKEQGLTKASCVIKDNIWIGAKATVLCGTTIEKGVVIGAGAVVTHNVDSNCVVVGVPAKKIKDRVSDQ